MKQSHDPTWVKINRLVGQFLLDTGHLSLIAKTMAYRLFLFDADDTLFDFKAAEREAFASCMNTLGLQSKLARIFESYRVENDRVWRLMKANKITKEELKVERFKRTFEKHKIEVNPVKASDLYLEALSEADMLIDHATEICEFLSTIGEVGIVTNGIVSVQKRRVKKSLLNPFISFIAVSEECGYAKPDTRFFEYSVNLAKEFSKKTTVMIGDRIDTDIAGAHAFGLSSCLFNPLGASNATDIRPHYEIAHLSEIRNFVG